MSAPSPAPPTTPPRGALARQFATILLLLVTLAVTFTYFFVQPPSSTTTSNHGVIVLVWSGMRPDMVTQTYTPNLMNLGANGAVALDHHAVFPSTTLANVATLATGAYPGNHVVQASADGSGAIEPVQTSAANGTGVFTGAPFWQVPVVQATPVATATPIATSVPKKKPSHPPAPINPPSSVVNLADDSAATRADTALDHSLVTAPTVARIALASGLAVSYEGADGTALIPLVGQIDATQPAGYVIDDQQTFPGTLASQIAGAGIAPPQSLAPGNPDYQSQLNQSLTQSFVRVVLPDLLLTNKPFLSVITYTDAASAAATYGLGSPEQLAALRADDDALGQIIDALSQRNQLNSVNIIVTSDHGLSDVIAPGNASAAGQSLAGPSAALRTDVAALMSAEAAKGGAGLLPDVGKLGVSSGVVTARTTAVVTPDGGAVAIWLPATAAVNAVGKGDGTIARQTLAREIVTWLQSVPQVGPIFVSDTLDISDGVLPFSQLTMESPRAPAILLSFGAHALDVGQNGANPLGYAGSAYADTTALAASGTLSRRDMHTILYALGPNFKTQSQDPAPTGAVDVAPTILHILGLSVPATMPGRVLEELLSDGGNTINNVDIGEYLASTQAISANGTAFAEVVEYEKVGNVLYINDGAAVHSPTAQSLDALIAQALAIADQE